VGRIDSVALDGRGRLLLEMMVAQDAIVGSGGHGVVHGGDVVDDGRDDVSGEDVTAWPQQDGRR
jgi:hypothetical protein